MKRREHDYTFFLQKESFKKWVLKPDPENVIFWQEYLKAHPEESDEIKKAFEILLSLKFDTYQEQDSDKRQQIFRNILKGQKSDRGKRLEQDQARQQKHRQMASYWLVAASLFVVIGLGIYQYLLFPASLPELTEVATVIKQNPKGRKSTHILPDGTRVKLNSDSKITYPETFSSTHREVHLQGEAFFTVVADPDRPFSVVAGGLKTTALGTAFNVQAWQSERYTKISLSEGKVRVKSLEQRASDSSYVLIPGQQVVHQEANNQFQITPFDSLSELGWREGVIVFDQASLDDMVNKLTRWYGVDFTIKGRSDTEWSIDGQFKNESLEEVMQSIEYTYGIKYTINDKQVTILL